MRTYGQFCPIAKAAEILEERWTLLLIREMLLGVCYFNDLQKGLPRISRSVLSQRLRSLERTGIITHVVEGGRSAYRLTDAGYELHDIIMQIGVWGQRWVTHNIGPDDLDSRLLMWDMRRRLHLDRLPDRRVVVQFNFTGESREHFWLVLEKPEPSLCLHDPGFDIDLRVTADTRSLHRVWIGRLSLGDAITEGLICIEGAPELARALPSWLMLSKFAHIPSAVTLPQLTL